MKYTLLKSTFIVMLLALLSGCQSQWVKVDSNQATLQHKAYTMHIPEKWLHISVSDGKQVILARYGIDLQRISVGELPQKDAFSELDTKSSESLLPSELAERFIANLKKANPDELATVEIRANSLATIDSHDGFKIHLAYKTSKGLEVQIIAYGVVVGEKFYTFSYAAPTRVYFPGGEGDFESMVSSVQFVQA